MTAAPVLVEVERGEMVESIHRGHLVILDESASPVLTLGDPDAVIYPRSAVKPLQAAAMLNAGLDIDGPLLALSAASHSGEPFHIEAVRRMLAQAQLSPADLQCPADLPYGLAAREAYLAAGQQPAAVAMNCSGKHAAMLWTCRINDWPLDTYLRHDHPLQVHLHRLIEDWSGVQSAATSVDGCGAPLWALSVTALARALLALVTTSEGQRVSSAMRAYPQYSGGTDRDVTDLMRGIPGLLAKDGAEAVQAMVADTDRGRFAIALKIEDGSQRARQVVSAAALAALGIQAAVLDEHQVLPVVGGGEVVGRVRPSGLLRQACDVVA
jgi:L-asparaginase II